VLLVLAPLASLSLAGQEHGRTIPLAVMWHRSPIVVLRRAPAASPARREPPAP